MAKEKINLDQLSYKFICKMMDNITGIEINLDESQKDTINGMTMLGALALSELYIASSLCFFYGLEEDLTGYIVGKSFTDAYIYWNKKLGFSPEITNENTELFVNFQDDVFSENGIVDGLSNMEKINENIYVYLNKKIFEKLGINKPDFVELQSVIAVYTKHILKDVSSINSELFEKYDVLYK